MEHNKRILKRDTSSFKFGVVSREKSGAASRQYHAICGRLKVEEKISQNSFNY
jgi:hypothetical protein